MSGARIDKVLSLSDTLSIPISKAETLLPQNNWDPEQAALGYLTSDVEEAPRCALLSEADQVPVTESSSHCCSCSVLLPEGCLPRRTDCNHSVCKSCATDYFSEMLRHGASIVLCPAPFCEKPVDLNNAGIDFEMNAGGGDGPESASSSGSSFQCQLSEQHWPFTAQRQGYKFGKNIHDVHAHAKTEAVIPLSNRSERCTYLGCSAYTRSIPGCKSGVVCDGGHRLCKVCAREEHFPMSCERQEKWIELESALAKLKWLLQKNRLLCRKCCSSLQFDATKFCAICPSCEDRRCYHHPVQLELFGHGPFSESQRDQVNAFFKLSVTCAEAIYRLCEAEQYKSFLTHIEAHALDAVYFQARQACQRMRWLHALCMSYSQISENVLDNDMHTTLDNARNLLRSMHSQIDSLHAMNHPIKMEGAMKTVEFWINCPADFMQVAVNLSNLEISVDGILTELTGELQSFDAQTILVGDIISGN